MRGMRFALAVLASGLLVLGLLLSCAPKSTPALATPTLTPTALAASPEWQRVLDRAKKEGRLTIYSEGGGEFVWASVEWFPKESSRPEDSDYAIAFHTEALCKP